MKTITNEQLLHQWQTARSKYDPWRNLFHIEMPFGLINDPNGLSFFNNEYQIFYQWNPFSCEHKYKHWGYVHTSDFINYSIPKIVLAPTDYFDKTGCYSGSGYVKDNKLKFIYTGNVKDENDIRSSYQIMAEKGSDDTLKKQKIIIAGHPKDYTSHFRDPFIFKRNGSNYIMIGAQRKNHTGCVVIYHETSDDTWEFFCELKTAYTKFGYMWECPNMLSINGADILLFCPQGLKQLGHKYINIYQSGYIAGKLNDKVNIFKHGEFTELDNGFDFYAPQAFTNANRTILIGWAGLPEQEADYPTSKNGWLHSLTLPRQLKYKNDHLYQTPIIELEKLRQASFKYNSKADNFVCELPHVCEIHFTLPPDYFENFLIILSFGKEQIRLSYNEGSNEICIDRNNMLLGGRGTRYIPINRHDNLNFTLFIDKSIMEMYSQNGFATATWVYYPTEESSPNIMISSDKNICFNLDVYELGQISYR